MHVSECNRIVELASSTMMNSISVPNRLFIWVPRMRCSQCDPTFCSLVRRVVHARSVDRRNDDSPLRNMEVAVPPDQRPVNELRQLKESPLYSWATLDLASYAQRLAILFIGVSSLLAGPIAAQTFNPLKEPLPFVLSASTGSFLVVAVAGLRIYLGWKYVADRLMTAALEYEETGWYDGQIFVKPPEILARDRLLGTYEVRPVLSRLRITLQAAGLALVASAAVLTYVVSSTDVERSTMRTPTQVTAKGVIYSSKVSDLSQLAEDDELANEEALAMGSIPGYCGDRQLEALTNAQRVCDNFRK